MADADNEVLSSNITLMTTTVSGHSSTNTSDVQDVSYSQQLWGKHIGMMIICMFALVGNASLVITIARHRSLWTNTNAFIVSLATADFLFAFPIVPLHILAESMDSDRLLGYSVSTLCLVAMSLTSFQIVISVTTMLALTAERYVSIVYPLKHRKWAQPQWVRAVIAVTWVYSVIFGALPLMGWNALHYYRPWSEGHNSSSEGITESIEGGEGIAEGVVPRCSFLIINTGQYMGILFMLHIMPACFVIPVLYIHMFCTIQKFIRRNRTDPQNHRYPRNRRNIDTTHDPEINNHPTAAHHPSSRRSLRLLIVIIIYFVFSWLPVLIWYLVTTKGFTHTHMTVEIIENIAIPSAYYQVTVNLGFANSAVNPYIYGLGNVKIRRAFLGKFRLPAAWSSHNPAIIEHQSANGHSETDDQREDAYDTRHRTREDTCDMRHRTREDTCDTRHLNSFRMQAPSQLDVHV